MPDKMRSRRGSSVGVFVLGDEICDTDVAGSTMVLEAVRLVLPLFSPENGVSWNSMRSSGLGNWSNDRAPWPSVVRMEVLTGLNSMFSAGDWVCSGDCGWGSSTGGGSGKLVWERKLNEFMMLVSNPPPFLSLWDEWVDSTESAGSCGCFGWVGGGSKLLEEAISTPSNSSSSLSWRVCSRILDLMREMESLGTTGEIEGRAMDELVEVVSIRGTCLDALLGVEAELDTDDWLFLFLSSDLSRKLAPRDADLEVSEGIHEVWRLKF
ncbi:hypothetical protein OGAPHI_006122 [Ogataea philodendri]|uniref:Uncharacterized protein n=1 Tax=Ogataea philodendri TaxID=1378263 RepID=A0A9P8NX90_9ASCO|nr:uncharacterized protein OGAPHI_006122 [Ogataea philodendri]KAH3661943.1 hypothetical protein OGAPHI_006122 [Ogataea philodendri]